MQPEIHMTDPVEPPGRRPAAAPAPQGLPAHHRPFLGACARRGSRLPRRDPGAEAVGRRRLERRRQPRRSASQPPTAGTGANGANGANGPRAAGGFFGRRGGGFTTGTVKIVQGSTLYVTTTDGNVVKVSVPDGSTITKSVTTKVSGIKPGDSVTAIGTDQQRRRQGDLGPRRRHRPPGPPRRRPAHGRPGRRRAARRPPPPDRAPSDAPRPRVLAWIAAPLGPPRPAAIQASASRVSALVRRGLAASAAAPVRTGIPARVASRTRQACAKWHSVADSPDLSIADRLGSAWTGAGLQVRPQVALARMPIRHSPPTAGPDLLDFRA